MEIFWLNDALCLKAENAEERAALAVVLKSLKPSESESKIVRVEQQAVASPV